MLHHFLSKKFQIVSDSEIPVQNRLTTVQNRIVSPTVQDRPTTSTPTIQKRLTTSATTVQNSLMTNVQNRRTTSTTTVQNRIASTTVQDRCAFANLQDRLTTSAQTVQNSLTPSATTFQDRPTTSNRTVQNRLTTFAATNQNRLTSALNFQNRCASSAAVQNRLTTSSTTVQDRLTTTVTVQDRLTSATLLDRPQTGNLQELPNLPGHQGVSNVGPAPENMFQHPDQPVNPQFIGDDQDCPENIEEHSNDDYTVKFDLDGLPQGLELLSVQGEAEHERPPEDSASSDVNQNFETSPMEVDDNPGNMFKTQTVVTQKPPSSMTL